MARDITARLKNLQSRRTGIDQIGRISLEGITEVVAKSLENEAYQRRTDKPYTKYALGSMQEVGPSYTEIGIKEATRVGKQLQQGLAAQQIPVDFRLQGSVPCNIHIRGASDVDLLAIHNGFFTYDKTGARSIAGRYNTPVSYTPLAALQKLRTEAEKILISAYPAADVDVTGAKAIKLEGGSLRRPIDVVPSHWHDTTDYQLFGDEYRRGIRVLDKKKEETVHNLPFLHIHHIGERDDLSLRGLKKGIRLCKNVKADAAKENREIALSSYDIAAFLWHADMNAFRLGAANELAILAETQRHLDFYATNPTEAQKLVVPDGSRKIFDTAEKLRALITLSVEIDDLAKEVAAEVDLTLQYLSESWDRRRTALAKAYIPA
jgi:hypothetical protein